MNSENRTRSVYHQVTKCFTFLLLKFEGHSIWKSDFVKTIKYKILKYQVSISFIYWAIFCHSEVRFDVLMSELRQIECFFSELFIVLVARIAGDVVEQPAHVTVDSVTVTSAYMEGAITVVTASAFLSVVIVLHRLSALLAGTLFY